MRLQGIDPVHKISQTEGVGTGKHPGPGAFVFVRAEGRLPGGLWSVLVDGKRLTARLDRPLRPGAVYGGIMSSDGTTIKANGPALSSRIADLLASCNLPNDKSSYLAVAALMGESLPLSPENLKAIRRALSGKDDAERARLAARALAAGLDPDDPLADRILAAGRGGRDPGDSGGGAHAGDRQRDPHGHGHGKGQATQAVPPQDAQGPEPDVEAALERAVAEALADANLRAFAAPGPDGKGWLYAPFDLSVESVDFSGFFRILFNYSSGCSERLVVDIRSGAGRRVLALSGRGERVEARLASGDESERKAFAERYPGATVCELDELDPGAQPYLPVDDDA